MRTVAIALIVLLAGCASSPRTRFYTLDALVPAHHEPLGTALTLQVGAVRVPAILDRQEMVRESAPQRLQVSDRHRWGAPLAEMIRGVLAQDLLARLPGATLLPPQQLPPAHARVLVLDVLRFAASPSGRVHLDGTWSVYVGHCTQPRFSAREQLVAGRPVRTYGAQAAAMSRLLGRLAERIAHTLRTTSASFSGCGHGAQNHP